MRLLRVKTDAGPRLVTVKDGLAVVAEVVNGDVQVGDTLGQIDQFETLPVVKPSKVIGIGLSYEDHADEAGATIPETPLSFAIYPSAGRHRTWFDRASRLLEGRHSTGLRRVPIPSMVISTTSPLAR